eukprot:scaffold21153_cov116-Isochrysis_galbana.AAC.1
MSLPSDLPAGHFRSNICRGTFPLPGSPSRQCGRLAFSCLRPERMPSARSHRHARPSPSSSLRPTPSRRSSPRSAPPMRESSRRSLTPMPPSQSLRRRSTRLLLFQRGP